jgi:plastocyanin
MGLLLAAPAAFAEDHRVFVGDGSGTNGFNPSQLTIHVGDTVTFTQPSRATAPDAHNVHATSGASFRCAAGCDGESGGSGDPHIGPWSDTITFDSVGDVAYQCDPHAQFGMRGFIHVVADTGGGDGGSSNVPITSGFTGAWFDPAQGGHGIFLEVLAGNQILAWWFTFTPDGQQAWFGNVGAIDPATNTATVDALQTQGGRWIPNFDPSTVTQPLWGRLTFSFTDCNHGRVDFDSGVAGYGEGHMDLTRLTQPTGLSCP